MPTSWAGDPKSHPRNNRRKEQNPYDTHISDTPQNLPGNTSLRGLRCAKRHFRSGVIIYKMSLYIFLLMIIVSTGLSAVYIHFLSCRGAENIQSSRDYGDFAQYRPHTVIREARGLHVLELLGFSIGILNQVGRWDCLASLLSFSAHKAQMSLKKKTVLERTIL